MKAVLFVLTLSILTWSGIVLAQGTRVVPIDDQLLPTPLKEHAKKAYASMKEKGYIDVPEEEVAEIAKGGKRADVEPMDEARKKVKVEPASAGRLKHAKAEGAIAHGALTEHGWSMLTRVFRLPSGAVVELQEWEIVGEAVMGQEAINENVNGYPAGLIVKKSPSGRAVTELAWYTARKGYVLRTSLDVNEAGTREEFLDIARAIED